MTTLSGKKGLIIGIANEHSLAYGCARHFRAAGAELAITYLNTKAEPYVRPLAEALQSDNLHAVRRHRARPARGRLRAHRARIGAASTSCSTRSPMLARKICSGRITDCSAEGFALAMQVSVQSFLRMAKLSEPLMTAGGCLLAMSYYGAEKAIAHYNVMGPVKAALEAAVRYMALELGPAGIRVNALSPGPVKTRAASGIEHFDELLERAVREAPEHRLVTLDDVGAYAAFLVSDAAKAITGNIAYVDAGYHVVGSEAREVSPATRTIAAASGMERVRSDDVRSLARFGATLIGLGPEQDFDEISSATRARCSARCRRAMSVPGQRRSASARRTATCSGCRHRHRHPDRAGRIGPAWRPVSPSARPRCRCMAPLPIDAATDGAAGGAGEAGGSRGSSILDGPVHATRRGRLVATAVLEVVAPTARLQRELPEHRLEGLLERCREAQADADRRGASMQRRGARRRGGGGRGRADRARCCSGRRRNCAGSPTAAKLDLAGYRIVATEGPEDSALKAADGRRRRRGARR